MGILKNPRDRIREFIFKKLCQEDFAIGPLFKVDFGKNFLTKIQFFAFYQRMAYFGEIFLKAITFLFI